MEQENGKELSKSVPSCEEEKNRKQKGFFHVDREMIRFKVHFFLFYGAMGIITPFAPLIAKDGIGISATSYAAVYSSQLFITVLSRTALGYIADYFRRIKTMISLLIIVNCLCFLSLLVIPKIDLSTKLDQNSTLLSLSEEIRNGTELYIISFSTGKVCNRSSNDSNLLPMTKVEGERSKNGENITQKSSEIICVAKSNLADKALCFELGNNTKENELFEAHLPFCCSTYSMQLEQYETQMKTIKNFFYLHSLNPDIFKDSVTASKPCTATFSDESGGTEKYLSMNSYKTYQFWLYTCIIIIAGTCSTAVYTLSDTICCESVQKFERDFGRQRIYSAVSWGIFAPFGGLLCDLTNGFFSTWILMAVMQILVIWNLYKMDLVVPKFSQNLTKDVGTVLKSSTFLAFNAGSFISGVWGGAIWYYLLWFISSLGASTFLCGLVPYVQCFTGEIPFMFFSGWVIEKVGHFNILSLSLMAYAVRFLWYSYLKNPWLVLPIEITHGITYGLFYSAAASFGKLSSEPGTEATTQSIIFSTHEGLGAGLGCVLAGIGFDYLGSQVTFFYLSLLAFGSTFLNVCSTLFVSKRNVVNTDISSSLKKSYNTMITNFSLFKPSRNMLSIETQSIQKTNPVGSSVNVPPDNSIILMKFEKK